MANKLYPLSSISQQIEDFAKETLFSVMSGDASEATDAEESIADSQKVFTYVIYFCFLIRVLLSAGLCHFCCLT